MLLLLPLRISLANLCSQDCFFKLSLMYKVVLQCWVLNAGKSLSTCSRNISQFNNLIQYLMSANFESPLWRIRETFVPQW